jgi:site-specific recombinase XerD
VHSINDDLVDESESLKVIPTLQASLAGDAAIERLTTAAKQLARDARSPATLRAYAMGIRLFGEWCAEHGCSAFPATPQTVALYAAALFEQGKAVATIRGRLVAIGLEHRRRKLPMPTTDEAVREVAKGVRRTRSIAQTKKRPLHGDALKTLLAALPTTLRGKRDRALLLIGYAGAFRRSELASMRVEWIRHVRSGLEIRLSTSKTDQEGAGTVVIIEPGTDPATCPVRILSDYLEAANITQGAVFRAIDHHGNVATASLSGKSIAAIVQLHVTTHLSEDATSYGAHSLRAGFATMLDEHGVGLTQIMRRGRWKSERVARGYLRSADWQQPLAEKLGL